MTKQELKFRKLRAEVKRLREWDDHWLRQSERASAAAKKTRGESMPEAVERISEELKVAKVRIKSLRKQIRMLRG